MDIKKVELVAPAGNWSALFSAVENGADSVYFGVKGINMRDNALNFDILEIKKIMEYLRANDCRGYLTLNTIVYEHELTKVGRILQEARKNKVDAVIAWDMGVLSLAKKYSCPVHLSTQASVANKEAFKFYAQLGCKRMVLARECSLDRIKIISDFNKHNNLGSQVEVFIHGAMCLSISGRCFLSQYQYRQSANRGKCLQPCRRRYLIKDIEEEDNEYIIGDNFFLSPKDLCTIDFIDKLIESGVDAFKIEGRMRSAEYSALTVSAYRQAIDYYYQGKLTQKIKEELKNKLRSVYNRGFSRGFYFEVPQDFGVELKHRYKKVFVADVRKFYKKIGVAELIIRNREIKVGDKLLFMGKRSPAKYLYLEQMQQEHRFIQKASAGQMVGVKVPFTVKAKDKVFLWLPSNNQN